MTYTELAVLAGLGWAVVLFGMALLACQCLLDTDTDTDTGTTVGMTEPQYERAVGWTGWE